MHKQQQTLMITGGNYVQLAVQLLDRLLLSLQSANEAHVEQTQLQHTAYQGTLLQQSVQTANNCY